MDEINQENTTAENPTEVPQPPQPPAEPQGPIEAAASVASVNYATFGERFVALIIDAFLVGLVTGILGGIFGVSRVQSGEGSVVYSNPFSLLGPVYYVVMTVIYGATLGKKVMNIRVKKDGQERNLNWGEGILREIIGKFLSAIVLLLGYLWMLWDPKKQTWHDKLAGSVVVKTK